VIEVREVLRAWLAGAGLRTVAAQAGVDRKTARRYVEAAEAAGVVRAGGYEQVTDEVIGVVVSAVRPVKPEGHGAAWGRLLGEQEQIRAWVAKDLTVVKIGTLLERRGVVVPYRTLHRFCVQCCGFGKTAPTVRVADGDPGVECQIDFARMGLVPDAQTGRNRVAHALIFTAVYSRHMFVWLTFSQTLEAVIAGCEAAWVFFGGVFKVLVPDNMAAIVADADPLNPRLTTGWLDYAQHCGFATDPTRVRRPKDKPRVERAVQYVRSNFFAGEQFRDLAQAQERAVRWCDLVAGQRIHGTLQARPVQVFAEREAGLLLPVPAAYDVPMFKTCKVHRDFHIEIGKALYSVPKHYIGQTVDVRADSTLVKVFHRGQVVKVHPRQRPGGRWTDRDDLPEEKTAYAMRDLDRLVATAHRPVGGRARTVRSGLRREAHHGTVPRHHAGRGHRRRRVTITGPDRLGGRDRCRSPPYEQRTGSETPDNRQQSATGSPTPASTDSRPQIGWISSTKPCRRSGRSVHQHR